MTKEQILDDILKLVVQLRELEQKDINCCVEIIDNMQQYPSTEQYYFIHGETKDYWWDGPLKGYWNHE